jgi:hypothetical protein
MCAFECHGIVVWSVWCDVLSSLQATFVSWSILRPFGTLVVPLFLDMSDISCIA